MVEEMFGETTRVVAALTGSLKAGEEATARLQGMRYHVMSIPAAGEPVVTSFDTPEDMQKHLSDKLDSDVWCLPFFGELWLLQSVPRPLLTSPRGALYPLTVETGAKATPLLYMKSTARQDTVPPVVATPVTPLSAPPPPASDPPVGGT